MSDLAPDRIQLLTLDPVYAELGQSRRKSIYRPVFVQVIGKGNILAR